MRVAKAVGYEVGVVDRVVVDGRASGFEYLDGALESVSAEFGMTNFVFYFSGFH